VAAPRRLEAEAMPVEVAQRVALPAANFAAVAAAPDRRAGVGEAGTPAEAGAALGKPEAAEVAVADKRAAEQVDSAAPASRRMDRNLRRPTFQFHIAHRTSLLLNYLGVAHESFHARVLPIQFHVSRSPSRPVARILGRNTPVCK